MKNPTHAIRCNNGIVYRRRDPSRARIGQLGDARDGRARGAASVPVRAEPEEERSPGWQVDVKPRHAKTCK
jgi:hypothetical protein